VLFVFKELEWPLRERCHAKKVWLIMALILAFFGLAAQPAVADGLWEEV
jgi:hypothetical protein